MLGKATKSEAVPDLDGSAVSQNGLMLLGYQRTKQISRAARLGWEAGNPAPLAAEIAQRGAEVFAGAVAEIWAEYLPLRAYLHKVGRAPTHVIDIGCGQAITDAFFADDFGCKISLVDIEMTDRQYHLWNEAGSGYGSLADARAMLETNGVAADRIATINPRLMPDGMTGLSGDMVTSFYSCGFHYPIADYAGLMSDTVASGGIVVLDLRRRYQNAPDAALKALTAASRQTVISEEPKAQRVAFHL